MLVQLLGIAGVEILANLPLVLMDLALVVRNLPLIVMNLPLILPKFMRIPQGVGRFGMIRRPLRPLLRGGTVPASGGLVNPLARCGVVRKILRGPGVVGEKTRRVRMVGQLPGEMGMLLEVLTNLRMLRHLLRLSRRQGAVKIGLVDAVCATALLSARCPGIEDAKA